MKLDLTFLRLDEAVRLADSVLQFAVGHMSRADAQAIAASAANPRDLLNAACAAVAADGIEPFPAAAFAVPAGADARIPHHAGNPLSAGIGDGTGVSKRLLGASGPVCAALGDSADHLPEDATEAQARGYLRGILGAYAVV